MNGWHRLWVFSSALYLGLVAFVGWSTFPNPKSIEGHEILRNLSDHSLELLAAAKDKQVNKKEEEGVIYYVIDGLGAAEAKSLKEDSIAATDSALHSRRLQFLLSAFAAWVLPCLVAYVLGWGIAWIRRGFRNNATG